MSEPFVWKSLKNAIIYIFCCGRKKPQADSAEEADTLSAFLATSYNVELVYIILKGITDFAKEQFRIEQGNTKALKSNIKRYVSNSQIHISEIKIKDPEVWDVMTAEDMKANAFADESRVKKLEEEVKRASFLIVQRKRLLSEVDGSDLGNDDLSIDVNVKVIVHAPLFFKSIQQANGVTSEVLIESLHPKYNRDMVFKVGEGAGASGSFFFFSADRKFIIKTMT